MKVINILKKLHKKITGVDIEKNSVSEILESLEENYAAQPGGGSEPTYETVAEIEVGTMEKLEGVPYYVFIADEAFPTLDEETYYFNSSNNPSDSLLSYEGQVMGILWNAKAKGTGINPGIIPIDPNKPWFGITQADNKIAAISDTVDLSNTTVRILKQVEQGGEDIPEGLKPTYVVHFAPGENDTVSVEEDFDDILAAINDGQNVKAVYSTGGTYYELQLNYAFRDAGSSDASIAFYMMMRNSTTTLSIMELIVERTNSETQATVKTMTVAITLDA